MPNSTHATGTPVTDNADIQTAGPRRPALRTLTMLLAVSAFMTIPAVAQRGHGGGGFGHGSSGGFHAPSVFRGGPRGPAGWSDFHHDTAPAKVSPHRFG